MHLHRIVFALFVLKVASVRCATLTDAQSLYTQLTSGYNKYLRQTTFQLYPTEVQLRLYIKSITGLDELNGILTTVVSLNLQWLDESLSWTPSSYGYLYEFRIDGSLIWNPTFITGNPAKSITTIGILKTPVRIYDNGWVVVNSADMLETTCDVDVTYFPFDTQECSIELLPWGWETDINMTVDDQSVNLDVFSENNIWILTSTSVEKGLFVDIPYTKITLKLKRRYAFFILNLFSPVLIMAFLNAMVFMLPSESGERVGYCITCLLALSVYMTFASESMPVSSKPIPILIYVLLIFILSSTFMCIGVIVGLKMHLYEGPSDPPKFLRKLCCLTCAKKTSTTSVVAFGDEKGECRDIMEESCDVTWKDIAVKFDRVCFVFSIIVNITISVVYLIVVIR
ncbi:hypothetical protein FSP39_018766 [Pinctada imbricata]|uniref:Uncharacterized protein n=1 Tax=Pinctada imbricata TaxID=66713 RepID=A0AA88XJJ0_PINIB|nr:hypothetical protein FSP39_018766 [Pinctada imbricata]